MAVGFRSGRLEDRSRTNWDGTGPRPIAWAAWYPTSDGEPPVPMRAGGPGATWFDIGVVARDAPPLPVPGGTPVVLVSHGTGGTAASMGWLAWRLAMRGIAVLSVDHHGNTATEPHRAEGFLCWWERAGDFSLLLDAAGDGTVAGCLDTRRVVVAGFSLGCHTALSLLGGVSDMERFRDWAERTGGPMARGPREFPDLAARWPDLLARSRPLQAAWQRRGMSHRDFRAAAALLLAPAPPVRAFTEASLAAITAPVHMLVGEADREAPARDGADWLAPRLCRATIERVGAEAGHFVFLPEATEAGRREAPALCCDAPGVDRRAIHDAVAATAYRVVTGATTLESPSILRRSGAST